MNGFHEYTGGRICFTKCRSGLEVVKIVEAEKRDPENLRGRDVCDRWTLDVAGPFPKAGGGERYVVAAVEYVTRYVVAVATEQHTAEHIAAFLMNEIVLKFGVFRELLTDGAPELTGRVVEQLALMLQPDQTNPVPYIPQMIGLVERFHRTWKDCVSLYMQHDEQDD
ncbi:Gag-pol fusion protein [Phytophthora megakarya]|uniref:Gag-pol fusion protein n=1 Tax=Phytophthora megakarya TaxID=4795 RepID=A0A225UC86_9STRA|nr:Gag-pol fusion protein [Phytophthora megakarya]